MKETEGVQPGTPQRKGANFRVKGGIFLEEEKKLARLGGVCGIIAVILFITPIILTTSGLVPQTTQEFLTAAGEPGKGPMFMAVYFSIAAVGVLGIVLMLGLYKALSSEGSTIAATLGALFGILGFLVLAEMIVVQGTVTVYMGGLFNQAANSGEQQEVLTIFRGLRYVDLGLDLVWDIFITLSMMLFGYAMLRHRRFGKVLGLTGMVIGALLLLLNLWSAPVPPKFDLGPVAVLWVLAVSIQMLRTAKLLRTDSNAP